MKRNGLALYHVVKNYEGFEASAKAIYDLIVRTQESSPSTDRHIYLDIEGHRNKNGGFDRDMMELLSQFLLGFLGSYVKSISTPIYRYENPKVQVNELPGETLQIQQAS